MRRVLLRSKHFRQRPNSAKMMFPRNVNKTTAWQSVYIRRYIYCSRVLCSVRWAIIRNLLKLPRLNRLSSFFLECSFHVTIPLIFYHGTYKMTRRLKKLSHLKIILISKNFFFNLSPVQICQHEFSVFVLIGPDPGGETQENDPDAFY